MSIRPHKPALLCLPLLCTLTLGCSLFAKKPKPVADEPAPAPTPVLSISDRDPAGSPNIFDRPLQRLNVDFKVFRISAPLGTFTDDETVWKIASLPLPNAAATLRLADNGFRAGIGRESDRKELVKYLSNTSGLKTAPDHATPDTTKLIEIECASNTGQQTVFYFDGDGALHGLDFTDPKARLLISFEMRSANLHEVSLRVTPQIEEPAGQLKWVITPEGAKQIPEEHKHSFPELAFTAGIPEDGFLLLGPPKGIYESPLLGSPFFTEVLLGQGGDNPIYRESVYIISPVIRPVGVPDTKTP